MKWIGAFDGSLADITSVVAGTGLSGGGTTGAVTLNVDASIPEITTLAGLTSFGAAGATTNIVAGDVTMFNSVNDGNPTISLGSMPTNRLEIKSTYNSGTQNLCDIDFTTYTASGTTNDGRFNFYVDEVLLSTINDTGVFSYGNLQCTSDGATLTAYDTTATSATQGGKLKLMADDGAAMASGHRLGVIEFYGAEDASNTVSVGTRIEALAAGNWGGSENKTNLLFYTTDGTTESEVLKLDSDKLATFADDVTVVGALRIGNAGAAITDTTASSATQGGSLKLIADDDAVLADNHRLGVIEFQSREVSNGQVGYSATGNIQTGARIQAIADATWSATENGTSLEFYTTDGNASESVVLTLDSNKLATFTGGVTVTGTITGNVTGDLTGEADTATTLATTRAINGVNFNGSAAITIPTHRIFGTKVKLLPNDFLPNEDGGTSKGVFLDDTAPTGLKPGIDAMELVAIADIPEGFDATHVDVFASTDLAIQVYEMDINASGITSRSSAGTANTTLALTSAISATATNFIAIIVTTTATSNRVWGGSMTITPS